MVSDAIEVERHDEMDFFTQWIGPVLIFVGLVGIVVSMMGLAGFFRMSEKRD